MNRLEKLQEALKQEYIQENQTYQALLLSMNFAERVENGFSWYPLAIEESGFTLGEYPYLTVSIDEKKLQSHQFKSGSIIHFFQNQNGDITENSLKGSIYYISKNTAKIILEADDFPEWLHNGKLGMIAAFDEKALREMEKALKQILIEKDTPAALLRDILYNDKKANFQSKTFFPKNQNLNTSQIQAIENILGDNIITVLHGPPGTGKTTTLVEAIYQKSKIEGKILVCAPSNNAVDLLVEKLAEIQVPVLRIGHLSRINEEVIHQTIEYKIEQSKEFQDIKKLRKQADEYRRMANKYKRNFGKEEREQRQLLLKEAKDCVAHSRNIEDYLVSKLLDQARVICTTLVGSVNNYLKDFIFDSCFIDEASQALEPATWIPILKSKKIILAGDPFQLPPTVKSPEAEKMGLTKTLLDITFEKNINIHLLDTQYRMNEQIMEFSNNQFYQGKLKAGTNVKTHYYQTQENVPPVLFIDTAGCGFDEVQNEKTRSIYNPDEAQLLFSHLDKILSELTYNHHDISIGIIAPYKQQAIFLKEFDAENKNFAQNFDVATHTIDSFQGQEKDIIYISLTRSNPDAEIGFLKDYRRMNVAMTRARKQLIILGDSTTLASDKFYGALIDFCQEKDYYKSAWEFLY